MMMDEYAKVASTAERIKIAMDNRNIKQADLVRLTGLDKGAVSCYISGAYEPKDKSMFKLAKVLNVSEMWLWGYDTPMERPVEQKNNDAKVDIVKRLHNDSVFFEAVCLLDRLSPEQLTKVTDLMELLCKDSSDQI